MNKHDSICPYCKNPDTKRLVDHEDLQPYLNYHKGRPFVAFSCHCCRAKWHMAIIPLDNVGQV